MKILLDENLPENLKLGLKDHDVSTVEGEGWRSHQNGELLRLMIASGFEIFVTRDTNMQYQQNLKKYSIPIIVLRSSTFTHDDVARFSIEINRLIKGRLKPGANELFLNN